MSILDQRLEESGDRKRQTVSHDLPATNDIAVSCKQGCGVF